METAQIVTLTPSDSKALLDRNVKNFRTIDRARVEKYKKEAESGNWPLTGDSIVVGSDGTILNGQHRLTAWVAANTTIRTVLVQGIDPDNAMFIDRGKPRTLAQWLKHENVKNATTVAAIARACVAYEEGHWTSSAWRPSIAIDSKVIQFAKRHMPAIQDTCKLAREAAKAGIPAATIGPILLIGSGLKNPSGNELAVFFAKALEKGEGLKDLQPVYHLRNRLEASRRQTQNLPYAVMRWMATLAWNKTVEGLPCNSMGLRMRFSGTRTTAIPDKILVASDEEYQPSLIK